MLSGLERLMRKGQDVIQANKVKIFHLDEGQISRKVPLLYFLAEKLKKSLGNFCDNSPRDSASVKNTCEG